MIRAIVQKKVPFADVLRVGENHLVGWNTHVLAKPFHPLVVPIKAVIGGRDHKHVIPLHQFLNETLSPLNWIEGRTVAFLSEYTKALIDDFRGQTIKNVEHYRVRVF